MTPSDCQRTCPIMCIMFRSGDRPLNLPLSCEVVEKDGFWPPICKGMGYLRFLTCILKSHSLPSMWSVLVEFRLASAGVADERRRRRRRRIRGKT